jgi:peptide/nickel transport system permease protein
MTGDDRVIRVRDALDAYRSKFGSRRSAAFVENKLNLVAFGIILVLVFCAVFAVPIRTAVPSVVQTLSFGLLQDQVTVQPFHLAPHDPYQQNLADRLHPPSSAYPFGTDQLGRDLLSRLMVGARISLSIAVLVVTISLTIGTVVGLVSGFLGGWTDEALMRLVDVVLAFPGLLLALVVAGILGPSLTNIMIALAVVGWTQYARIVRGSVLSVKEREFVKASQMMGVSRPWLVVRHIVPNVISPVIVLATLDMAYVILATAGLSFLGLGAQPPTPEWGTMLSGGRQHLLTSWWIANVPGVTIMLTVLGFNILGDSLRDSLDPREASRMEGKGGL